jgi:hypothetical protein
MQFIRQKQRVTTCPQCDNVVHIDAEICNICGQRLKPGTQNIQPVTPMPQSLQPLSPPPPLIDDEEEEEEEYDEEEFEQDEEAAETLTIPSTPGEILAQIQRLQEQSEQIAQYFPAHLPDKTQKLDLWQKQLQRAWACVALLDQPQLQQLGSQPMLKLRHHLEEAARALDFTREYNVKVIGHTGAGKSTLLAAMIGQDIFPRLAGGAVTGVRTRIRLCGEQEPEELRIHFLTRHDFDDMLRQTHQSLQNTTNPRMREALATELSILLKASEAFAAQYLHDEQRIEVIPRERWKEESSRYIEEPIRDSQEPRIIRLIDYVEYTIHANSQSFLPLGSILVDLPGGAAGQPRHDAMLREELNEIDALILVIGNNRFGDDDRTQRIFELVKRKIVQGSSAEIAARMIFLVVTHWDEINSTASKEKALGSLRPLLSALPPNYSSYHHHGTNSDYFFYPIRGIDALLARLGLGKQELDVERHQEGRDYAGRILSVYPELLQINSCLPATANAQDFLKVTTKQHEAMLTFSGLPELINDLQVFLSNHRYDVQLRHAETQLTIALQYLEDLSWEQLNQLGVQSHDLHELEQEMQTRQSKRGAIRFEQLQKRTQAMHTAWNEALQQFDTIINTENNAFHRAILTAHERATHRIKIHIMQGLYDHFIKMRGHASQGSSALEIGERWVDIDGWNLIRELRTSFSTALEREISEPARTLAEAFLIPITHKEEIEGSLDIKQVALGEFGGDLDEIQKAYNKLKRIIRDKARDVCFYVSMGELLNEDKYAPSKDDPSIDALYRLTQTTGTPEEIIQKARQLMEQILDIICGYLAQTTEKRITHLFRYELDKLETRRVYDSERLEALPNDVLGTFAELVNYLYSLLTERVAASESLRNQLDKIQESREATVDSWIELLKEAELLRTNYH